MSRESSSPKAPFTAAAKVAFGCIAFTAVHAGTLLIAGYVWVFTGRKFPPFAKYEDGMILFVVMSVVGGGLAALFASINPGVYGWRQKR